MEDLKKNILPMENEEIKEILETHKVIDEIVVANSDAIKQIDLKLNEIIVSKPLGDSTTDTFENTDTMDKDHVRNNLANKCSYYNRGHC